MAEHLFPDRQFEKRGNSCLEKSISTEYSLGYESKSELV